MPAVLYQIALIAVIASIRFNRVAVVIALAWLPGEIAFQLKGYEDVANMISYIVAMGAALALTCPDAKSAIADRFAALLFAPMAVLAFVTVAPETAMLWPVERYWSWASLLWLQIAAVMAGNDWGKMQASLKEIYGCVMKRAETHMEGVV